ncbi:MAG: ParB/RepB/Spo0J family partition protein [Dissulfurispiraceae bacterium]
MNMTRNVNEMAGRIEREDVRDIEIDKIVPNRYQPRALFDDVALEALADSIRNKGVLQPIIVRDMPDQLGEYELVVGERRLRATKIAGLTKIPAILRRIDEADLKMLTWIENVQREDLNFVEKINSVAAIRDDVGDVKSIATMMSVSQRTIERYLSIHRDINATEEFAELFDQQAKNIDYSTAQAFAAIAAKVAKLRKSDKREYYRIILSLERKGIGKALPSLKKKYGGGREHTPEGSLGKGKSVCVTRQTASVMIFTISWNTELQMSQEDRRVIEMECKTFLDRATDQIQEG